MLPSRGMNRSPLRSSWSQRRGRVCRLASYRRTCCPHGQLGGVSPSSLSLTSVSLTVALVSADRNCLSSLPARVSASRAAWTKPAGERGSPRGVRAVRGFGASRVGPVRAWLAARRAAPYCHEQRPSQSGVTGRHPAPSPRSARRAAPPPRGPAIRGRPGSPSSVSRSASASNCSAADLGQEFGERYAFSVPSRRLACRQRLGSPLRRLVRLHLACRRESDVTPDDVCLTECCLRQGDDLTREIISHRIVEGVVIQQRRWPPLVRMRSVDRDSATLGERHTQ